MPETALFIGGLRFRLRLPAQLRADREISPFVVTFEGKYDVTVDYLPDESVSES